MHAMSERFDSTHWSVVLGARAQDPSLRNEFGERYAPIVRAYFAAYWHLPADDPRVEDATQDVFLQCFRSGGVLDNVDPARKGGFRAYLFGVARNIGLSSDRNEARRRSRTCNLDTTEIEEDSSDSQPDAAFHQAWARHVADEAFQLMQTKGGSGAEARVAMLRLRYFGGLSPREIARRAGLPVEETYRLLYAARGQFRAALLDVVARYSPGTSKRELVEECRDLFVFDSDRKPR